MYGFTKYLLIVESPAKCKKIEGYLGKDYKCLASYGHLCGLNSLEDIDYESFTNNKYTNTKSKYKQITTLKEAIKSIDVKNVIIAVMTVKVKLLMAYM